MKNRLLIIFGILLLGLNSLEVKAFSFNPIAEPTSIVKTAPITDLPEFPSLFDAWGEVIKIQDGNNNLLTSFAVLDRGYTGHEHLQSVALVHMNGRLYDAKLHRFLQPDNFVQDPI